MGFIEDLNIPIEVNHWDSDGRNMIYNKDTGNKIISLEICNNHNEKYSYSLLLLAITFVRLFVIKAAVWS